MNLDDIPRRGGPLFFSLSFVYDTPLQQREPRDMEDKNIIL